MPKIIEKIVEPSRIEVGSFFKIKVKAIRYVLYGELKNKTVGTVKNCTVKGLKGE
jgi:hypothetical protein